jgi:hypothetical protein
VAELNGKCVVTDMVWSEHAAYQFCSVLWDSYSSSSVQVHIQTKGVKP